MRHSACHPKTYGRPATVLSNGRYVLLNQDSTLTWCSVEKDHLGSNRGKRLRVYTLPFIVKVLTFAP